MSTKIEWATETWNPVTGCSPISPGCQNCYAARMAKRLAGRHGYPKDNPFSVTLHPERLNQPFKYKNPRRVFVCSMGDLFHNDVPFEFIKAVLARTCGITTECHTFIVLTKRPARMKAFFEWMTIEPSLGKIGIEWPLPNIWLGVTAENQDQADKRIPLLMDIPATVRFVSVEPMLGPVDLTPWLPHYLDFSYTTDPPRLDWVIAGGETGTGARPIHPDWVLSLRDQCVASKTPFFFKSWGEFGSLVKGGKKNNTNLADWIPLKVGKKRFGRNIDGVEWNQYPQLNVRGDTCQEI